jgi:hypothetical protein
VEGIETGLVSVPSLLNRSGNFSDSASSLTGKVKGASLAQTLSSRPSTQCVFPKAIIPQQAFGLPAFC